jgi:hypothetical protein
MKEQLTLIGIVLLLFFSSGINGQNVPTRRAPAAPRPIFKWVEVFSLLKSSSLYGGKSWFRDNCLQVFRKQWHSECIN